MAIAEIIKFEGPKDALVWKNPGKYCQTSGQRAEWEDTGI